MFFRNQAYDTTDLWSKVGLYIYIHREIEREKGFKSMLINVAKKRRGFFVKNCRAQVLFYWFERKSNWKWIYFDSRPMLEYQVRRGRALCDRRERGPLPVHWLVRDYQWREAEGVQLGQPHIRVGLPLCAPEVLVCAQELGLCRSGRACRKTWLLRRVQV